MDMEEELSLKLIAKLEELTSENNRLHQHVLDNEQRESMLESKISRLDAQLEDAMADIVNLEASQLAQPVENGFSENEHMFVTSTPVLLPQNQVFRSSSSTRSPIRVTASQQHTSPYPQKSPPAPTPSPSKFKPWESGGIRTQIADFMTRMEELEKENDSLRSINVELQNLNVMQQSKMRDPQEVEELEVALKRAKKQATDMATDMSVLVANQQTLLTSFEQKNISLTKMTQEYNAYKSKRKMELREFELRLSTVIADFKKAEISLQEADERKTRDEATIRQSEALASTMQRELDRKTEALQQMRAHTSKLSENFKVMGEEYNADQRSLKLEMRSLREEGKEKDMHIAKLLAEKGDMLSLEQQKKDLQQHCHDLLSVIEAQQEMIQSLRNKKKKEGQIKAFVPLEVVTPKPLRPNEEMNNERNLTDAATFASKRISKTQEDR